MGKSSTPSNLTAACSETGKTVMLISCDQKSDTSITLLRGRRIPIILDLKERKGYREEEGVFERSTVAL